ncbi:type I-F CRISPR-associated helicase Cas3f [Vulcaniibacterium tengchongense]|uniref:CRISPR-associated endonuclease/helicase Cas3 n=1 Tax=Vulcaniibacterium tengchongense TaxID=1273429 RepID=A0A3N4W174_9GAMM|nr:type I-F CRISPR-associated helicase Cas3f [Vulcaniibacterium tengchongense]RPE79790.1 CRISPR-associated endonuclease/helicase Cas3 [Vulcaniibacterium tengchongense]
MNVLLVCECDKRALVETRRILDQFAERRGERTWQTAITEVGLATLRKLLRKTARKNTAVACHWIRGRDHTELLWIVGDARRFNAEGAVPTNTTARDVLRREDEDDWHNGEDVRLLARLAALLHDLGKASVAFQERLRGERAGRNQVRHEWVSLRLFLAFVGDDDDAGWLRRLADDTAMNEAAWTSAGRYLHDGPGSGSRSPFADLVERAPLAAAIGWLIVTHHRLPTVPPDTGSGQARWGGKRNRGIEQAWLRNPLAGITCDWNEVADPGASAADLSRYWELAGPLPVSDPAWHRQAARVARRLLQLQQRHRGDWLDNVWVLHLARLCLMLADHHYSGLGVDRDGRPVPARQPFVQHGQALFANTYRDRQGRPHLKQSLLEHLLGVGDGAGQIAHALPGFERRLPRLAHHRGLRKRSADPRFAWQDKAFDAAVAMREAAREHGAFIVDMASTGCGKTLANARILYALADPQRGLRASFALGLRTLTLQTGRSYRRDLRLDEDELAVLVGGAANRALFEFHERQAEADGSASAQSLLEEDSHVLYEGDVARHPLLSRALADAEIRKLLSAPLLVCTVDHLAPASESLRAGRQIAPLLRLMSSDLVLDELDDYDMDDLPALARLVFFAGMAGARVVLSSATMPPALVQGMFRAYQAGRRQYRRNRGADGGRAEAPVEVPCLWVDEFGEPSVRPCIDAAAFIEAHGRFVEHRIRQLEAQRPLRVARLQPLAIASSQKREAIRTEFAGQVLRACLQLHREHAGTDPHTGRRASFGLVRMAHVDRLIDVAQALARTPPPDGVRLHLCVYHARFPLAQRSAIESMLDAVFDRRTEAEVWQHPAVRPAIDAAPDCEHLFVVLASPVCEVGRDWDADWAVAEPSSMRSVIQLAGRVQRHRCRQPAAPNVVVFDTNLRALERPGTDEPAFVRPGFEKKDARDPQRRFLLATHRLQALRLDSGTRGADGERIDAVPRIRPLADAARRSREHWVALEHARMEAAMQPLPGFAPASAAPSPGRTRPSGWRAPERDQACLGWQFPQATLLGVLPQQQPFREDPCPDRTLVFLPDDGEETLTVHRVELALERQGREPYVPAGELVQEMALEPAPGVVPWGTMGVPQLLDRVRELAEAEDMPLRDAARKFTAVEVPPERDDGRGWQWHPWLGFRSWA